MSRDTPLHIGSLYDHNDSPFHAIWDGRAFIVYLDTILGCQRSPGNNDHIPRGEPYMSQPLIFGNCLSCLTCGPVHDICQSCNNMFVPFHVLNSNNSGSILHYAHPIVLAVEAEKPCILPNDVEEFNNMYIRQINAHLSFQSDMNVSFCALTTDELRQKISNLLIEQPMNRHITHDLHFSYGFPTSFAVVKRQQDYLLELLH